MKRKERPRNRNEGGLVYFRHHDQEAGLTFLGGVGSILMLSYLVIPVISEQMAGITLLRPKMVERVVPTEGVLPIQAKNHRESTVRREMLYNFIPAHYLK